ncbi:MULTISPECIES: hemolysin family protein [unclassified Sphingomonas]|uniref:hemolysin family protein n=1 Tax=unclassified Sphingomonas TaxID=196159 RepID=UPI0006FA56C9|nr:MULTISPECIES: hemolysin family protein [unclassified Sphingomonas]KQX20833.1 magnesium/cobalt efflux protein [Sphingomonas sp. Root1294]KQY68679.1 magnesium/cobalt efflux protein [Sphingomonas sp. Root50]KRB88084.1 magnesium/cobalt efflux protein [Sphingomonas sp. Root720]
MPDDSSSSAADSGGRWWRGLRSLFAPEQEPSLRDQIEEVIEEHAGDDGEGDDLSTAEREMLRNILHFGERTVGDIGVPRGDIIAVPETISFDELIARFAEAEHSRLPVYGEDLDHVIGMVHVKDVFRIIATGAPRPDAIAGLIRQPRYVPSSMRIIDLLAEMRETRTHLAIVLNEYSGTDGLVTIEDLVEEIVGDIEDEHDEMEADLLIPLGDAIWSADARAELEDVARLIDPRLADIDDDVETLGGLASALAGQVPQPGQIVEHPSGWRLEITDADERRVRKLLLHPPVAEERGGEA